MGRTSEYSGYIAGKAYTIRLRNCEDLRCHFNRISQDFFFFVILLYALCSIRRTFCGLLQFDFRYPLAEC